MENFSQIIAGDKPTLVDFYASWCNPCRTMHAILEELKQTMDDSARVLMLDIDSPENKRIVELYNIRSVPTLMIFRRGEVLWRRSGVVTSHKLESLLTEFGSVQYSEPVVR